MIQPVSIKEAGGFQLIARHLQKQFGDYQFCCAGIVAPPKGAIFRIPELVVLASCEGGPPVMLADPMIPAGIYKAGQLFCERGGRHWLLLKGVYSTSGFVLCMSGYTYWSGPGVGYRELSTCIDWRAIVALR